ncbi:hydroxyacylglutathione hydrolase [Oceanospirillum sanctuarii]|uniref:hydroxyacylglutathione hydrolase n=1 Tax=Oceanospirillum sanctuarii TaxID=1434821 RepID=UPI000A398C54|nr:hydroxyacylglutathione hydrolase [Oceanospirillum sanctuarii]
MLEIKPIPAFNDNYIWIITNSDNNAWVVDPGDATPVIEYLSQEKLSLKGILITHHHKDHTGGVKQLKENYSVEAYGADVKDCTDNVLTQGDSINVLDVEFSTLSIPGHTLDHIGFYSESEQTLFCGDTLFYAGCGRIFEGTPEQMYSSLQKLAALPDDTKVFPTHEYTQSNLKFASAVEPDSPYVLNAVHKTDQIRNRNLPTLPTTIGAEKCHNPFLRSHQPPVIAAATEQSGTLVVDPVEVFAAIRQWKDNF